MNRPIFEFDRYKDYLLSRIEHDGRGSRQKMATAMNCQLAYVSIVLSGDRHFSIDQSEALSRHFGFDRDEAEFFIWLVERERAGTDGTFKFFSRLLEKKREDLKRLERRIDIESGLKESAKSIYYSDKLYSAIHMAVTVPTLQTRKALAARFSLSIDRVGEIVEFLKEQGLVSEVSGQLKALEQFVFLERNSPYIGLHHGNWRIASLASVARRNSDDTHLSMVVSVAAKDVKIVNSKLTACLEEIGQIIKASKEEEVMALNLDFFRV